MRVGALSPSRSGWRAPFPTSSQRPSNDSAIVAARLLVPLLIPPIPLVIVAALVLDAADQTPLAAFTEVDTGEGGPYPSYDKALHPLPHDRPPLHDPELDERASAASRAVPLLLPARRDDAVRADPGPSAAAALPEHLVFTANTLLTGNRSFSIGDGLLFAYLITLVLLLYDQYRPLYVARFRRYEPTGARSGASA